MAQFETSAGIDKITGKLDKQSDLTMRQKHRSRKASIARCSFCVCGMKK